MGMPMIIGAGVGALSSAAMGKSPLTGALLGGVTGGAFGGAGGFGSGFSQGGLLSSAAPAATGASVKLGSIAPNFADDVALNAVDDFALNTSLPANVTGGSGASINFKDFYAPTNLADDSLSFGQPLSSTDQMFTNNLSSQFTSAPNPLALDPRRLVVDTPLTFGERLSDLGSSAFSYGKENPMTLLGGANTLSGINAQNRQAQQQRLSQAAASGGQGITRPNFDPSSAIAAAPTYGLTQDELAAGKVSQLASKVRLPEEDERALRQFYTSLIG
jgi:hypothetical protein